MPLETEQLGQMAGGDQPDAVPPFCVACGYDLTGAVSKRCPECGCVFVGKEWRQKVAQIQRQVVELREANDWVRYGLRLAVAGVILLLIAIPLQGTWGASLLRGLAAICGGAALFLGLGLFRIKRLPPWAYVQLGLLPNHRTAIGTILLGGGTATLAVFTPW